MNIVLKKKPSPFLLGFASIIDVGDTLTQYTVYPNPEEEDKAAIASDWEAVGRDLRMAIHKYSIEDGKTR